VNQINAHFRGGLQLDRDVLLAVLEVGGVSSSSAWSYTSLCVQVNGGNVQNTIAFLQAGQGDFVDPGPAAGGLPPGYMTKPANWVQPKSKQESREPGSVEVPGAPAFRVLWNLTSRRVAVPY
jgi:hypothetical protein